MSATGYEETELSYHVEEEEEEERGGSVSPPREGEERLHGGGRGGESGERLPGDSGEERERVERGGEGVRGRVNGILEGRGRGRMKERGGGSGTQIPVLPIPPHVLSQLLASPGFKLQDLQDHHLLLPDPGHPPSPESPLNLESRRPQSSTPPSPPSPPKPTILQRKTTAPAGSTTTSPAFPQSTPQNLSMPRR